MCHINKHNHDKNILNIASSFINGHKQCDIHNKKTYLLSLYSCPLITENMGYVTININIHHSFPLYYYLLIPIPKK